MIFKNRTNDVLEVPALGVMGLGPGDTFEATGEDAKSLLDNPNFARVDTPARQRAAAARRSSDDTAPAETEES